MSIDAFAGWEVGTNRSPVEQEEPPPLGQTEHDLDNLDPERAAHLIGARSVEEIEQQAPKKDRPVADPTTRPRILPWTPAGNPLTARLSNAGERAVMAVWLAATAPADLERAETFLITEGAIDPQGKKR